jgi:wobble nucleotide-excising tRNase
MLTRLQLIRNVGQFDSVASTIALTPLCLLYAENGRGKTTITSILRSLSTGDPIPVLERRRLASQHPPHVIVECSGGPPRAMFQNGTWNRTLPELVVFDDSFVDQNICSGLTLGADHRQNLHEWILGAQGVALSRQLREIVGEIEEHNRALRARADAIPSDQRGAFNVEQFCALGSRENIEIEIQATERNLAAARQQDRVRTAREFQTITLPGFHLAGLEELLGKTLSALDAAALSRVQAHFAMLGERGEAWVAERMEHVAPAGTGPCPFCAQELSASPMLAHFRAYFSEEYAQLKSLIGDSMNRLDHEFSGDALAGFERAFREWVQLRQFWSGFSEILEIGLDTASVAQAWTAARDSVRALLMKKQAAPLDAVALPPETLELIRQYELQRESVTALNLRLQEANAAIAMVKEQAETGDARTLAADLAALRATQARYVPEIVGACEAYLAEKHAKEATEGRRDAVRTALDQHRQAIFPTFETAINLYLQRFNAGFRLGSVASVNTRGGSSCTYNVLINNQPVAVGAASNPGEPSFRTSLSAGDRNALALAFFFASLDQDQALADKVVVIDDPITSLDEHRSLTTVQEVRQLAGRASQVIVLSHDKRFLCRLWEGADTNARTALEVIRDGQGSTIQAWNVTADLITEHDRRHEMLKDYVSTSTPNAREVAQALRPHLEAFLRVAYPREYPPGRLLGDFCGICQQRLGTPEQVLDAADLHELNALREYGNLFHHDTNLAWQTQHINDAELLGFVQRVLAFVRR